MLSLTLIIYAKTIYPDVTNLLTDASFAAAENTGKTKVLSDEFCSPSVQQQWAIATDKREKNRAMPFGVVCLDNGGTWTPLTSKCSGLCEHLRDPNNLAMGCIHSHSSQPGSWPLALKTRQLCGYQRLCLLFLEPLQPLIRSPVFPAIYFRFPFSSFPGFSWGVEPLPLSLASWLLESFHTPCLLLSARPGKPVSARNVFSSWTEIPGSALLFRT